MQIADREIDRILKRLKHEGLAESTMVIISGDNGRCHIRGKQFLYDPGLHVPYSSAGLGTSTPAKSIMTS